MSTATLHSKPQSHTSTPAGAARIVGAGFGARGGPAHQRPSGHEAGTARAVVFAVIRRIEGYLDEETTALDKSPDFDLKASNDRKSQGLVDLNQAMRHLRSSDIDEDLEQRLRAFRSKLAVNLRKIRLHLDAVKEITAMLSDAIRSADSDGTYTRHIGPYRSEF